MGSICDIESHCLITSHGVFTRDTLDCREYGYGFRGHCIYQQYELTGQSNEGSVEVKSGQNY